MLHTAFGVDLAKAIVRERAAGAGVRRLPRGDVARAEARLAADRRAWTYDRLLSAAGALALLTLVVVGPAAVLTGALGVALVAAIAPLADGARRRVASTDRWQVWRTVEPDPEYLRRGGA